MASVTFLGVTFNTTAGNKTVTATPAVNDLIVIFACTSGLAGGTTSCTDDNSSGTYTKVDVDRTGFSTTGVLQCYVRTALVPAASSTIFTANQASSSGGGLAVYSVAGMVLTGSSAVRRSSGESTGTSGFTPAPILSTIGGGLSPVDKNPILMAVACGTNSSTNFTPRTVPAYTEGQDNGYNTPATGLESGFINEGEFSGTITWGSTAPSTYASLVIELETQMRAFTPMIFPGDPAMVM